MALAGCSEQVGCLARSGAARGLDDPAAVAPPPLPQNVARPLEEASSDSHSSGSDSEGVHSKCSPTSAASQLETSSSAEVDSHLSALRVRLRRSKFFRSTAATTEQRLKDARQRTQLMATIIEVDSDAEGDGAGIWKPTTASLERRALAGYASLEEVAAAADVEVKTEKTPSHRQVVRRKRGGRRKIKAKTATIPK